MSKVSKHILVIRLSAMGDVAMSVPVLRAFTEQHPEVKITVLSRGLFKPMFNTLTNVNFYVADVKGNHKGILGLFKLYKELKHLQIDAIADIHNVLRSKILRLFFIFSNVKKSVIDKGRAEKKTLTRAKNKIFKPLKTTHERYADVFRKLGFNLSLEKPTFPKKPSLLPNVSKVVPQNHLKWIGIAPFAQYDSKMYPLDLLSEVIKQLAESNTYTLLLFGGGLREINILKEIASKYKNTINVAGILQLNEELNLIANLDVMISMDSANAHLAAMLNIKTITLWGITHPFAGFAPFNQPASYQLLPDIEKYPNIPCSVYGNKVCDGYEEVMRNITPEKIISKINEVC